MRQALASFVDPRQPDGLAVWCAAVATGLMFCGFASFGEVEPSGESLAALTMLGRAFYAPEREIPIYAAGCGLAVVVSLTLGRRRRPALAAEEPTQPLTHTVASRNYFWIDGLFCAALALLLYIPRPDVVAGECFSTDRCHHWDFYALAPTLAFAGGRALGTDVYSQYGVGWPMVFAALGRWVTIGYGTMIWVAALCGSVYFIGVYVFLRRWTRSVSWSIAGTLLALNVQMFTGVIHSAEFQPPLWQWPSSTILRSTFDVPFFCALLAHARTGRAGWLYVAGATLGLAILFGTDTGIYLACGLAVYRAERRSCPQTATRGTRFERGRVAPHSPRWLPVVTAWSIAIAICLIGLSVGSRGTLTQARFWSGWLEVFTLYPSGISQLRVFDAIEGSLAGVLLAMFVVAIYLRTVCRAVYRRAANLTSTEDDAVLASLAVYGLAYLVQYIGRSHPANLSHVSVPWVLIVVIGAWRARGAWPWVRSGVVPMVVSIALLAGNRQVWWYPNVLHDRFAGRPALMPLAATSSDLLVRESTEPVSGRYREAIAAVRALHAEGKSFWIFANDDTALYLYAGAIPPGRYSPLLGGLLTKAQADAALDELARQRPDYVLLPGPLARGAMRVMPTEDVQAIVRASVVAMGYVGDGAAGHLERWRRPLDVH